MRDALRALVDGLAAEGLDPHALVIARDGEIVAAHAWAPWAIDRPALSYSASKTFTSLAIGFLESEGRLHLDDSAGELLGIPNPHGLTVRHLLTMNTGHSVAQIEAFDFDVAALLSTPPAARPGTSFAYNSDATYALSCIVAARTGQQLTEYLRPRLLDPLGIERRWMKPARGIEQGASGFHLTAVDLARLGILLADGGRLDGQQVVPASYMDELAQAWSDTREPGQPDDPEDDWTFGYGYQVWRNREGFRVDGAYGQFAVVLPERGLVIAYQGAVIETRRTMRAFWRFVHAVGVSDAAAADADADAAPPTTTVAASTDSWDARAALSPDPDAEPIAEGVGLDDIAGGWRVTLPPAITGGSAQTIEAGDAGWHRTVLDLPAPADTAPAVVAIQPAEPGTVVVVEARGETDADGVLVHVVVPTSPHRLIVRRGHDGTATAAWHTAPLRGATLATVAVPAWLTA